MHLRHVDLDGRMRRNPTAEDRHWSDAYDGRFGLVVYGHSASGTVRRSEHAIGIDTGCVFGGRLTAAVVEAGRLVELVSVRARATYASC